MADTDPTPPPAAGFDGLGQMFAAVTRAQAMLVEQGLELIPAAMSAIPGASDPATVSRTQDFWRENFALWQRFLDPAHAPDPAPEPPERAGDRRFKAPQWHENPVFDLVRRSYFLIGENLMRQIDAADVDEKRREQLRFSARAWLDAVSPTNFPLTNPEVIERTIETRGENLVTGMRRMLTDMGRGQMTHTDAGAFEIGRNLATTPGKVIKRTPMYELIQYNPTTETVMETPLVIFPPWINRFYILDLTPEKSFIRWAVEQGISVFMVSWKSADAGMKDVVWDDYVAAQMDAIETAREVLSARSAHAIGYCVAGTTLAATLAVLTARGRGDDVATATFFTAQVDFSQAGDLKHFTDDDSMRMIESVSREGFLDGRYMAATFNLLRGRDLIWNYVTNNYLLGKDYSSFDLLHWNGDITNLPAKWHKSYLTDLYRDNLLATPGALSVMDTPLDLGTVTTPAYIQAGREDHIAPAESVWSVMHHLKGPLRFVLAGSGHIAGVVNPPSAGKYQYWTNDQPVATLAEFVAGATETKGSWWPDWLAWLRARSPDTVPATGARIPGEGAMPALEDAPGSYVRLR